MKRYVDEKVIMESKRYKNPILISLLFLELVDVVCVYLSFKYIPAMVGAKIREIYSMYDFDTLMDRYSSASIEVHKLSKLGMLCRNSKWYLLGLGIVLLIFILYFLCFKITLTDKTLYGVKEFGKKVVIPIVGIRNVSIGGFNKIVVEEETRKSVFYGINNYRKICSEIQDFKYDSLHLSKLPNNANEENLTESREIKESSIKNTISCELCGGKDLLKQNGVYICQKCGAKYTVEEARKLMSGVTTESTVSNITTTVLPAYTEDEKTDLPAKGVARKVFVTIGIIIILGFSLFFAYKKIHIKQMLTKAEKSIQARDYITARRCYNEALKWDEDNIDLIRAKNSFENDMRRRDGDKIASLYSALAYTLLDPQVIGDRSYKKPKTGDYSLYEFCSRRGDKFQDTLTSYLGTKDIYNYNNNLVSILQDNTPASRSEIRVGLYKYRDEEPLEICVYVSGAEYSLYSGAQYKAKYRTK